MVTENRHLSLREITAELSVSFESIRTIFSDCLDIVLHHDNAPSHKAIIVNKFLARNSANIIKQRPYSHKMALADFFSFQSSNYHFETPVFSL